MKKRINTPKLVAIATTDATHFIFQQSKEVIERDQRKARFLKRMR